MIKNTQDVFKKKIGIFSKQNYKNSDHYIILLSVIITLMCLHLLSCRFKLLFSEILMPAHLKREAAIKKSMLVGGDERQREN